MIIQPDTYLFSHRKTSASSADVISILSPG